MLKDTASKAREYAFLLLKFRLRSEYEIAERLQRKKFAPEVIKETIRFLREKSFLDDAAFCRLWLSSRLKKKLGLRRICRELRQKGIDKDSVEEAVSELKEDYSETDTVRKLAQERLKKLKGIEPLTARRRTYAYLLRRGFSPEIVQDTLSALCKPIY